MAKKKDLPELETPLNAQERYMHAISARLDVLIDMLEGLLPKEETPQITPLQAVTEPTPKKAPAKKRTPAKSKKE